MLLLTFLMISVILISGFFFYRYQQRNSQAKRRRSHQAPALGLQNEKKRHLSTNFQTENIDADEALGLVRKSEFKQEASKPKLEKKENIFSDYLVLHVIAPKESPFVGYELLQAILSNGLRYGDRNIFHRHETKTGRGQVLFSLASINKPGTFELSKMGSYTCPGLTLFMFLKTVPDPMLAFDALLETARQLAEDLGGEVWDDQRQSLNMDKVAQIRARIRRFEESQRTPDFFEDIELETQG